jgi:hypothetical protein
MNTSSRLVDFFHLDEFEFARSGMFSQMICGCLARLPRTFERRFSSCACAVGVERQPSTTHSHRIGHGMRFTREFERDRDEYRQNIAVS